DREDFTTENDIKVFAIMKRLARAPSPDVTPASAGSFSSHSRRLHDPLLHRGHSSVFPRDHGFTITGRRESVAREASTCDGNHAGYLPTRPNRPSVTPRRLPPHRQRDRRGRRD